MADQPSRGLAHARCGFRIKTGKGSFQQHQLGLVSSGDCKVKCGGRIGLGKIRPSVQKPRLSDRKSTRLNSSH